MHQHGAWHEVACSISSFKVVFISVLPVRFLEHGNFVIFGLNVKRGN